MPGSQEVHYDQYLTEIAIGYRNHEMIAKQLCNLVPVKKQSDRYRVYDKEKMRKKPSLLAPKTAPNIVSWGYSQDSYFCDEHGLRAEISKQELANADNDLDLFGDGTEILQGNIEVDLEIEVAALFQTLGSFPSANQSTPSVKWDQTTATIAADCVVAHQDCFDTSGFYPDSVVMSEQFYRRLRIMPAALDYFENVSGGLLTLDQLKNILGVENVYIGKGIKNTAKEGQDDSIGPIWLDDFLTFFYKAKSLMKKDEPSTAGLFQWTTVHEEDGVKGNNMVSRFYDKNIRCWVVDVFDNWDVKVLAPDGSGDITTGAIIGTIWT